MRSFCILETNVVRFIPKRSAAPLSTTDHPVARFQRSDNVIAFYLSQAAHWNVSLLAGAERIQLADRGPQHGVRRENHGAFHKILQLTNISGPAVAHQGIHGFSRNLVDALAHSLRVDAHKMPHQLGNILGAHAARAERE